MDRPAQWLTVPVVAGGKTELADRQADGQAGSHTDTQTHRQTNTETEMPPIGRMLTRPRAEVAGQVTSRDENPALSLPLHGERS